MNNLLLKLYVTFQELKNRVPGPPRTGLSPWGAEEGQDLVEYALVVALIAFGAVVGMTQLAKGLNSAFSIISSTLVADL
jgi:pilus assembly protein Flp/PilA